jgi:HPt (histidine-containing phosphotransfer) domain-containing protein
LEGALTLASALHTRERLLQAVDRHGSVIADISGVDDADVTFVQLLVAAQKSATATGGSIRIGANEGDATLVRLLGAAVAAKDFPQRTDVAKAADPDPMSAADEIDPAALATLVAEIGAPAVSQSLGVFFYEMASRLRTLAALSPATELAAVMREAHLLKGTAGTFGLNKLSSDVAELERTAPGIAPSVYQDTVTRMTLALQRAQATLEASMAKSAA